MPYTLSHAVVALPLSLISFGTATSRAVSSKSARKIPIASIAVGSMSPDFPYLMALTPTHAPGHSLSGVVIYCLIPSLLILLMWYRLLERETLRLFALPKRTWSLDVFSCLLIVLGVLSGAISHVLWDATSHSHGIFVQGSDFWQQHWFSLTLIKWNQYTSGVVGLLVLAAWYIRTVLRNRHEIYQGHLKTGLTCYLVSITFFIGFANILHGSNTLAGSAVHTAIAVMVGGVLGTCCYVFICSNFSGKHKKSHS